MTVLLLLDPCQSDAAPALLLNVLILLLTIAIVMALVARLTATTSTTTSTTTRIYTPTRIFRALVYAKIFLLVARLIVIRIFVQCWGNLMNLFHLESQFKFLLKFVRIEKINLLIIFFFNRKTIINKKFIFFFVVS